MGTILLIAPIILGVIVVGLENFFKSRLYIDRLDKWIEKKEQEKREKREEEKRGRGDKILRIIFWLLKKNIDLTGKIKNKAVGDGIKITIAAYLLEIVIFLAIYVAIMVLMVIGLLLITIFFIIWLSSLGEETKKAREREQYRFDEIETGFLDSLLNTKIKTLKCQGEAVGKLEPGGIFDEKGTQIIKDETGKIVGKITLGGIFDSKDTQIIRDEEGNKIGTIESSILGERIISINYKDGARKGRIEKNILGETKIRWD